MVGLLMVSLFIVALIVDAVVQRNQKNEKLRS
jgi:hypothetical protein